jgi:glycosyltransferase involved in cell wall biosynthesis
LGAVPAGSPRISVCIVSARRPDALDACLASLQAQESPPSWELLVISDGDPTVADVVHRRFPDATVGIVPRALPGAARNHLIERATGEFLLFLDDDVEVEPHLLARLDHLTVEHPEVGVFGGPNVTPRGSATFELVQGAVLSSIVATGPVRRRYGPHPSGPADQRWFTLCNLAVRRSQMVPFADDLVCAEENAMLVELQRRDVAMRYDTTLRAFHQRRPTLRGFAQQMRKYGRGRGQLLARDGRAFHLAYLVPSVFLLYLVALPLLLLLSLLAAVPAAVYVLAVLAASIKIATSLHRLGTAPLAALLTVVVHASYGVGVPEGLVRRFRTQPAQSPSWVRSTAAE